MYRLRIEQHPDTEGDIGVLVGIKGCDALIEELDAQWQGYSLFDEARQAQARVFVEAMLAKHPGFVEAALALAIIQLQADETEAAAATLDTQIRKIRALLPKRHLTLPVGRGYNILYHRLLRLRMNLHVDAHELAEAGAIAKAQLRADASDPFGVRHPLALLMLAVDDLEGARRALAHLVEDQDALALLAQAFYAHARGATVQFRQNLARALIRMPVARKLFVPCDKSPCIHEPDIRGIIIEPERLYRYARPVLERRIDLLEDCVAFLQEPEWRAADTRLREDWEALREMPISVERLQATSRWREDCEKTAIKLGDIRAVRTSAAKRAENPMDAFAPVVRPAWTNGLATL